ncbi:hypothetical protein EJ03DRAFT_326859 [Teratosphaeria nubilosa]|uniref:Uncharacterized protein n=1 Tax=Teratosphaeria nubilosa TaxID=161662 RepID=A0A6G1LAS9_9PEZI|nr:hypothetical protein EJ03DRAFT_326859 [Teratosphaeria nubilosa]
MHLTEIQNTTSSPRHSVNEPAYPLHVQWHRLLAFIDHFESSHQQVRIPIHRRIQKSSASTKRRLSPQMIWPSARSEADLQHPLHPQHSRQARTISSSIACRSSGHEFWCALRGPSRIHAPDQGVAQDEEARTIKEDSGLEARLHLGYWFDWKWTLV